ncbi:hypothetical protein JL721_2841 [Aureococcus anophagefferens]|nr:hypothetical protein JL721_2841 [Aureococcus anophagefferens]
MVAPMQKLTVQLAFAEPPCALALQLPEHWGSRSVARGVVGPVLKKKRCDVTVDDVELTVGGAALAATTLVSDVDWGEPAVAVLRLKRSAAPAPTPTPAPEPEATAPEPPKATAPKPKPPAPKPKPKPAAPQPVAPMRPRYRPTQPPEAALGCRDNYASRILAGVERGAPADAFAAAVAAEVRREPWYGELDGRNESARPLYQVMFKVALAGLAERVRGPAARRSLLGIAVALARNGLLDWGWPWSLRRMLGLATVGFAALGATGATAAGLAACDPGNADEVAALVAAAVARDGVAVVDGCFGGAVAECAHAEAAAAAHRFAPAEVGAGARAVTTARGAPTPSTGSTAPTNIGPRSPPSSARFDSSVNSSGRGSSPRRVGRCVRNNQSAPVDEELGRARRRARDIRGARAASVVAEATIAQPLGMLSVYAAGARFERHVDNEGKSQGCDIPNVKGSSLGGDARVLTAVYYVNDAGWDCGRDGGALRLWDVRGGAHRDVAPARDRLVVFLSRVVAHEVRAAKRALRAVRVVQGALRAAPGGLEWRHF